MAGGSLENIKENLLMQLTDEPAREAAKLHLLLINMYNFFSV